MRKPQEKSLKLEVDSLSSVNEGDPEIAVPGEATLVSAEAAKSSLKDLA